MADNPNVPVNKPTNEDEELFWRIARDIRANSECYKDAGKWLDEKFWPDDERNNKSRIAHFFNAAIDKVLGYVAPIDGILLDLTPTTAHRILLVLWLITDTDDRTEVQILTKFQQLPYDDDVDDEKKEQRIADGMSKSDAAGLSLLEYPDTRKFFRQIHSGNHELLDAAHKAWNIISKTRGTKIGQGSDTAKGCQEETFKPMQDPPISIHNTQYNMYNLNKSEQTNTQVIIEVQKEVSKKEGDCSEGSHKERCGKTETKDQTLADSTPDDNGYVQNPSDPSAYVPITKLIDKLNVEPKDINAFKRTILEPNPDILRWQKSSRRLVVHLVSWNSFLGKRAKNEKIALSELCKKGFWICRKCNNAFVNIPRQDNCPNPDCKSSNVLPVVTQPK